MNSCNVNVMIQVSEPWGWEDEKTGKTRFKGVIIMVNDNLQQMIIELEESVIFKKKEFIKILCETRHADIFFNFENPQYWSCALSGIPEKIYNPNQPYTYSYHDIVYLIGEVKLI